MPIFMHLLDERTAKRAVRSGVRGNRYMIAGTDKPIELHKAIFCMPVVPDFFVTYQWIRELRRLNQGPIAAILFRLQNDELLYWGHYGKQHELLTASQVAALGRADEKPLGFEAILPRRLEATEILRYQSVPQGIGWRYYPDSHGKPPFCGCPSCVRGNNYNRRVKEDWSRRNG